MVAQTQLLSKGLNFCPTPGRPELSKTEEDFDLLHCSMWLRHFFHSPLEASQPPTHPSGLSQTTWQNKDEGFDNRQFHNPSKFNPKGPGALEAFICSNDTHNSLNRQYKRPKDNLMPDERKALKELKSLSDSVIIKPADKGSAVVHIFIYYPKSTKGNFLHQWDQSFLAMVALPKGYPNLWTSLWRKYPLREPPSLRTPPISSNLSMP